MVISNTNEVFFSEEEDPDEYPFPLTLRTKKTASFGAEEGQQNGN